MEHETERNNEKNELFTFKLQSIFDKRYVLQEGDYKIIKALVIGVAGLILTSVVVTAFALIFKK